MLRNALSEFPTAPSRVSTRAAHIHSLLRRRGATMAGKKSQRRRAAPTTSTAEDGSGASAPNDGLNANKRYRT